MASPQCEDGYTRFANELLDQLVASRIPGQELRIVLFIARKTYGFQKKSDNISYGQIAKALDISRPRAVEHIKSLTRKNIIGVLNNGNRKPLTLWINKDYQKWLDVPKKGNCSQRREQGVPKDGNKSVPIYGNHKRKKENIQKKVPSDRFLNLSEKFLDRQSEQHPNIAKKTKSKIEAGAKALEDLEKIDGYDLEKDIKPALRWAINDDFWSLQILSLGGLRKKGKNGEMKFVNLLASKAKQVSDMKNRDPTFDPEDPDGSKAALKDMIGGIGT
jgi:phage replication O-like protein O